MRQILTLLRVIFLFSIHCVKCFLAFIKIRILFHFNGSFSRKILQLLELDLEVLE
jgi:hypothetical protein